MTRKIVEQTIPWRGSISDLATDVAGLLTLEEGAEFSLEIQRFLAYSALRKKFLGHGHITCTCYDDGVMCVLGDGCPEHDHRISAAATEHSAQQRPPRTE